MPTPKFPPFPLLAVVMLSALTACGQQAPVQTVPWYKAHDVEREAMLDQCAANPGELMATPNCINARTANNQLEMEGRIHTAPLPIPGARPRKPGRDH